MNAVPNLRHFFIELISYWQGSINSSQLSQQFGLSAQQCRVALREYQQHAPHNLSYSNTHKAYLACEIFECLLISDDVNDYLHWLQTGQLPVSTTARTAPCQTLALPTRQVAPAVMRGLVEAIKKSHRLDVDYVSLTNPCHQGRVIAPHSFINTGLRWHLRAYCEKSSSYRDFVLSRFRGVPVLLDKSEFNASHDTAWNTPVTVILQPDSRLSPAKRAVIEQDYQMQNGQLTITTKGCLVNYLLRELQVNTKMLEVNPEAQQLVLMNLNEIKPWLFES
ncbi:MAG: WYL domain-containing protein [Marinagarivorans sp.]|nr:WYL domain-containing protein [Marinagarivorans sp.]